MENMMLVTWSLILMIQTIFDIKWRKIPWWITAVGVTAGLCFCMISQRGWVDILWSLVPGMCCFLYTKISREALGLGDSLILCAIGLVLDIEHMLLITMLAFGLAGIGGLFMLVCLHKKRNYEMPFVLFLFLAFLIDIAIQSGGYYG